MEKKTADATDSEAIAIEETPPLVADEPIQEAVITDAEPEPDRVVPAAVLRFLASTITAVVSGDSYRHRSELAASALAEIDRLIG